MQNEQFTANIIAIVGHYNLNKELIYNVCIIITIIILVM